MKNSVLADLAKRDPGDSPGQPKGKENGGVGGGSCPHGMEEKLSSPPRHSALACRARLPCTLRRDPWGFEASRALHRHRGGPNLKMLPLSLRAEVLHSLTATASPRRKEIEGWVGAPARVACKKN